MLGGRWNRIGYPVVYCAVNRALAYLETLANLLPSLVADSSPPGNRCLVEVSLPNGVWEKRYLGRKDRKFPSGWDVHPAGKGSIDYGTAWLTSMDTAILVVPSVVVPDEDNILINPLHPDTKGIRARNTGRWQFDPRLFRS